MGRRKTGSILKRGNRWYIYYTINGKQHTKATNARNKTEAQQILNKYLPKEIDYENRGNIKISEYAELWLKRKKGNLKPSVFDRYKLNLKNHIFPYFKEMKLNIIFPGEIQDFVTHLSNKEKGDTGKKLSPKTVNNILLVLSSLFEDAVDDMRIERNPIIYKKHKRVYNYPEKDFFTIDEMNIFLEKADKEYYTFFLLLWHTALRTGEAVGLKLDDVDWDKGTIKIRRSIYRNKEGRFETNPKSKRGFREIFLTPQLQETLEQYINSKREQSIDGYIFERKGQPYVADGIVKNKFKQALRKSGLRKTLTPR